ncbi:hypothetical protein [Flavobacterium hercynium]|uniref:Uncharacterized protein n=1 Tax=Flavobacterium hercynium TaxID=387094 RepID=A0A226GNR1_9FLAO|nr:hypothetical protein [Flavobacterium hercynium]OXA83653.1 hypothetical protein B0A66_22150 [Flavobacterium hercynium]SMP37511.1 hypothetical protein SAMN06265346_1354 [Flavobacterium hercynium]
MNSQKTNLPPFSPVTSKPSTILNYGLGLLTLLCLFLLVGMLFMLLCFIPLDEYLLFVYCLIFLGIVLQIVYIIRTTKHTTTIIDSRGIHYINKFNDKVENTILWDSFRKISEFKREIIEIKKSPDSHLLNYDIFSTMVGSGRYSHEAFFSFVLVNGNVEMHKEKFSGNHIFSMVYSNRLELARTLLLGLSHFRPDLTIHPGIFAMYYIDSNSFVIEYEKRRKDINTALFIIGLVVMLGILFLLFALL